MKKLILTLSLVLVTSIAFSQSALYQGSNQLNVGFGFSNIGVPLYIGLDHAFARDFTVGGELSYRAYNERWNSNYVNHNIIGLSANVNYHFNNLFQMSPRWDLYAGPNLGFYIWTSPDGYTGNSSSRLGFGAQVGIRHYFTNSLGINLEFGSGNAFTGGKLGLSFRL